MQLEIEKRVQTSDVLFDGSAETNGYDEATHGLFGCGAKCFWGENLIIQRKHLTKACTFVIKSKEDESAEKYLLLGQIRAVLSSLFFFDISTAATPSS